jgi:hypothetical protein
MLKSIATHLGIAVPILNLIGQCNLGHIKMSLLQQLEMASMVAEEKYMIKQFNFTYMKYREQKGILESMTKALKDLNLYNDYVFMMEEKV